jgi:CheY-like chemotaxis protein
VLKDPSKSPSGDDIISRGGGYLNTDTPEIMVPLSYSSPPLAILVVDDEPTILMIMEAALREDGHYVKVASNGREALRLFRETHWDVVLTDRSMPEMNGDKLAAAIKGLSPRTPVVMVTGTPPHSDCPYVDAIVSKPFSRAKIAETISQVLAARAGAAEPPEDYSAAA